jgi:hypothetical protein
MYDIKILARRVLVHVVGGLVVALLLLFISKFFPIEMAAQLQTRAFEMVLGILGGSAILGFISDLEKFLTFKDSVNKLEGLSASFSEIKPLEPKS